MLLTNTKVGRFTKALVVGMGEHDLRHPTAMGATLEAIDNIAEYIFTILQMASEKSGVKNQSDEEILTYDACLSHHILKTKQEVKLSWPGGDEPPPLAMSWFYSYERHSSHTICSTKSPFFTIILSETTSYTNTHLPSCSQEMQWLIMLVYIGLFKGLI